MHGKIELSRAEAKQAYRLHVRALDMGQLRFVTRWSACCGPVPAAAGIRSSCLARVRASSRHGKPAGAGTAACDAGDVHYLRTRGARAAAVLAADAAFAHVLAERTAVVPRGAPYQPGEFYLRELPPIRGSWTVCAGSACCWSMAKPIWTPPAGPAWARMRTPSSASR